MKMMKKAARGFTLIELMIVVAIIGILAAIAIPNFLKYQLRTRRTEGSVNVAAIRTAQIAFFGNQNTFVPAPTNPAGTPPGQKKAWDHSEPNWQQLGFEPEGDVYYMYTAVATGGAFLVDAKADLDSQGPHSCWVYAKPRVANDGTFEMGGLEPSTNCDPYKVLTPGPNPGDEPTMEDIDLADHYNKVFLYSGEDNF